MLRTLLRSERVVVIGALGTVIALAWVWLLCGAGLDMGARKMLGGMGMVMIPAEWTASYSALILLMWTSMMLAMMLPSAAPTILLVNAIVAQRRRDCSGQATGWFTLGYICVWLGFSLLATLLQWCLDRAGLLSDAMATTSTWLTGALLICAGVYQLTPLKHACLNHCRAPFEKLARYWGQGPFIAGLHHGVFCLGCCWALMSLLFVLGLMNILWIGALAVLVLAEKISPFGVYTSRLAGAVLIAWGASVSAITW